jgi:hypothetical protein
LRAAFQTGRPIGLDPTIALDSGFVLRITPYQSTTFPVCAYASRDLDIAEMQPLICPVLPFGPSYMGPVKEGANPHVHLQANPKCSRNAQENFGVCQ